jgi:DNA primase
VLRQTSTFYPRQLERYPEAGRYLEQRGLRDPTLIRELRIGYAPGGSLRRHLVAPGYSLDRRRHTGLVNPQGHDALSPRVVFPCCQDGRIINLYGRSTGDALAHRFLPGFKGGFVAWESVRQFPAVILVEGLFDLAVLGQAGFRPTTCALGTQLNPSQFRQLCDRPRTVYRTFDVDANGSGQQAAQGLARRLRAQGIAIRTDRMRTGLPLLHEPLGEEPFQQGSEAGSGGHDCPSQHRSRRDMASRISSGHALRYQNVSLTWT